MRKNNFGKMSANIILLTDESMNWVSKMNDKILVIEQFEALVACIAFC